MPLSVVSGEGGPGDAWDVVGCDVWQGFGRSGWGSKPRSGMPERMCSVRSVGSVRMFMAARRVHTVRKE